ncbi:glycogen-binding subunit 76A-like [Daphnia carinata]|uniref:glycogen-binding subunit 76A-like n=1 Tax=Daphnia carinata TaxID=120202 RepID=UPI00257F4D39|nr:glycogen-binding subunit 76A-like [Daphnia carinata]
MNLETLSSPGGDTGAACSLSSLLALGCRSRAEAAHSFAKKLQTKLWSLSPLQSTTDDELSSARQCHEEDLYNSWAVEARFDLNSKRVESVVTSVPLITPNRSADNLSSVVYTTSDFQLNKLPLVSSPNESFANTMDSSTNFNNRNALDGSWVNYHKDREVHSSASSGRSLDQESDSSSTTTTNPMSDSDQYFDFGIETPVDLDSAGEETVVHEPPIVINCDDGLPGRGQGDGMESGYIFGSPTLSGEEDSDNLKDREEEPSFYESLSQSPASAGFAQKANHDRFNFNHSYGAHVCEPFLDRSDAVNTNIDMNVSGHNGLATTEMPVSNTTHDNALAQSVPVEMPPTLREMAARASLALQGELEGDTSNDFLTDNGSLTEPLQSEIIHSSQSVSPGSPISSPREAFPDRHCFREEKLGAASVQVSDVLADLFKLKLDMVRLDPIISDQSFGVTADIKDFHADEYDLPIENGKEMDDRHIVNDNVNVRTESPAIDVASNTKPEVDDGYSQTSSEVTSTKESTPSKEEEETDNENDDQHNRPRVQRSTSLKTCKTPPGTPGGKKIVRFADALGLDLALVRTFLDEVPHVPQSAFDDLAVAPTQNESSLARSAQTGSYIRITRRDPSTNNSVTTFVNSPRILIANFTQPGNMPDFLDRVKRQKISLETACMVDDSRLRGVVRVLNLDFHKSVLIRFTVDEWRTQADQAATYVPDSCDGLSDRFTFILAGAQTMQPGQRLIFAICYRVAGQEIWDSNQSKNYVFQCISNSNYLPSIALNNPLAVSDTFLPYM